MSEYKMRDLKTGDIYKMSRILKKMNINLNDIDENTTMEQAGVQFIQKIFENLHLAEDEMNEFLAELIGITPKEFSELPITKTIEIFNQFMKQKDIVAFLKLAGK